MKDLYIYIIASILLVLIFVSQIITKNTLNNNIKGIIVTWSGNITDIPAGWAFCNGEKYSLNSSGKAVADSKGTATPDLRSRFIVGAAVDKVSSTLLLGNGLSNHSVKKTGGAEKVTLSKEQIPSHNHDIIDIINRAVGCIGSGCITGPVTPRRWPLIAKSGDTLVDFVKYPKPKFGDGTDKEIDFEDHLSPYSRPHPNEFPVETGFMGGSKPHENMPPYFALAYIIKL
jgi:microcystin-dependent protein